MRPTKLQILAREHNFQTYRLKGLLANLINLHNCPTTTPEEKELLKEARSIVNKVIAGRPASYEIQKQEIANEKVAT